MQRLADAAPRQNPAACPRCTKFAGATCENIAQQDRKVQWRSSAPEASQDARPPAWHARIDQWLASPAAGDGQGRRGPDPAARPRTRRYPAVTNPQPGCIFMQAGCIRAAGIERSFDHGRGGSGEATRPPPGGHDASPQVRSVPSANDQGADLRKRAKSPVEQQPPRAGSSPSPSPQRRKTAQRSLCVVFERAFESACAYSLLSARPAYLCIELLVSAGLGQA
jgi:hypothetical protein